MSGLQEMLKDFRTRVGDIWELYEDEGGPNRKEITNTIQNFADTLDEMIKEPNHELLWNNERCVQCDVRLGSHRCPNTVPGVATIKIEKVGQVAKIEIVGAAEQVVGMIERALIK